MIDIPEEDIAFLNGLEFDPGAEPFFEYIKSCLIWPDEGFYSTLHGRGRDFLYDLLIIRGFLHRGISPKDWSLYVLEPALLKESWDYGLARIPEWPGFRRLVLSEEDKRYLFDAINNPSL